MAMSGAQQFERVVAALREYGSAVRQRRADSVRATCPAHRPDRRPSLVVTRHADRVLVHCFAGCRTAAVLQAIGLTMADLFAAPPPRRLPPEIIARYPYEDFSGRLIAEKVRFAPKLFRWRTPAADGGWRWGLHGATLGLYRAPHLIDTSQVLVAEGEKAVDALVRIGFAATCGPAGASAWSPTWTEMLWRLVWPGADVIVLPDADAIGRRHADRVAAALYTDAQLGDPELAPMRVKLLDLPGVATGADVVDWLDAGHTAEELRGLIGAAPYWSPGGAAQARLQRRRGLARERKRRERARKRAERAASSSPPEAFECHASM